ncbi:MAG: TIGR00730 family Rossman fold protein [Spirochaetaceae bacterium]|nr:MAG: TIGR00730 family Rossman fold protein [Spirochaetaceae bacterium]
MHHVQNSLKRICVFCGSSSGIDSEYGRRIRELGAFFAENELVLVYGGGSVGLMGELARAVMSLGGKVIGVIPKRIHGMVETPQLTELHVVENMHERKAMMYELSDAFIVLPGGIGTVEEFFEIYTWCQLGIHLKPIGLLNIRNYFDRLLSFVDHMVAEGFLKPAHRNILVIDEHPRVLLARLRDKEITYIEKL